MLINNIKNVLNCGFITKDSNRNIVRLMILNFEGVYYNIFTIFNKYKIRGVIPLDYLYFWLASELVAKKTHWTL